MPDLATKARELLFNAVAFKDVEKTRQLQSQFEQRRATLQSLRDRLQQSREFTAAVVSVGGLSSLEDKTIAARARDRLEAARQAFQENPESLLDDGRFRTLQRTLESVIESLEQGGVAAWAGYANQVLPPPLGDYEQLLRADPRTSAEIIDRLVTWDEFLHRTAQNPRPSISDITQFSAVLQSRKVLWADIPIEEETEVATFIRASGSQGAPLRLLTAQVQQWLSKRGLFDAYVVKKKGQI